MADEPKEPDVVPLDDPTVPDSLVPIPDPVAAPTPYFTPEEPPQNCDAKLWRLICLRVHALHEENERLRARVAAPTPHRVQRQRTKGWTMPADTVYVGRPSKWGNPFVAYRDGHANYDPHSVSPEIAVDSFRRLVTRERTWSSLPPPKWPKGSIPAKWVTVEDVQQELRGKHLACWCPLDQPCHADVLLELANGKA